MRTISLNVSEQTYERFKTLAAAQGRSAAELIREAMVRYLGGGEAARSLRDLPRHGSGGPRRGWTREEVWDEMIGEP